MIMPSIMKKIVTLVLLAVSPLFIASCGTVGAVTDAASGAAGAVGNAAGSVANGAVNTVGNVGSAVQSAGNAAAGVITGN